MAVKRLDTLQVTAKDREQLFWAAAVLDVASAGTLEQLGKLMSALQPADLGRQSQPRLFQAHMALERLAPSAAAGAPPGDKEGTRAPVQLLPGEVLAHAEAAWRCALADAPETQVCSCLLPADIVHVYVSGVQVFATAQFSPSPSRVA